MLSEEQVWLYREQGYLLVEDVIEPGLLERLRQATAAMLERSRAVTASDAVYDLDAGHSAASPRLRLTRPCAAWASPLLTTFRTDWSMRERVVAS